jgi:hypothetical protein
MAGTHRPRIKRGVLMSQDFDHLLADHLLARERATRGREGVERDPAPRSERVARSGDGGPARGVRAARGAALLMAWFR